jgi:hypothetical protein
MNSISFLTALMLTTPFALAKNNSLHVHINCLPVRATAPGDGLIGQYNIRFTDKKDDTNLHDDGNYKAYVEMIDSGQPAVECTRGATATIGKLKLYPIDCAEQLALILLSGDLKSMSLLLKTGQKLTVGPNIQYKCTSK